jgi:hypothetical protein
MPSGYRAPIAVSYVDGPTLTAASSASMLPASARYTFAPNSIGIGTKMSVMAELSVSTTVTTPGTGKMQLAYGTVVFFDSTAIGYNTNGNSSAPMLVEIEGHWRGVSTAAYFVGLGKVTSACLLGSSALTANNVGTQVVPATGYSTGNITLIDITQSGALDFVYTPSVATASVWCRHFALETASVALI